MIVVETIGKEKDGQSDVALRFLVDKQTYDSIPAATFKEPLKMSGVFFNANGSISPTPNTIGNFETEIRRFQNIRSAHAGEIRIPDSESVTKITLSQYASKRFSVMAETNPQKRAGWFLAGDSAMGMPFYRSINAGLIMGAELARLVADPSKSADIKSNLYEATRQSTIQKEFSAVARRTKGIEAYQKYYRPAIRTVKWTGIGVVGIVTLPITLPLLGLGYVAVRLGVVRLM